jgi:hypothetical protein
MDALSPQQVTLLWFLAWAVVGSLVGFGLGKFRARELAGAVLGAAFGPLGWLFTLALSDRRPRCPQCRGVVLAGATRCRHCGSAFLTPY